MIYPRVYQLFDGSIVVKPATGQDVLFRTIRDLVAYADSFAPKCAAETIQHEAQYEADDEWASVECACGRFYYICESPEVAETEFRNHVDLATTASTHSATELGG